MPVRMRSGWRNKVKRLAAIMALTFVAACHPRAEVSLPVPECNLLLYDASIGTAKPDCAVIVRQFEEARSRYAYEVDIRAFEQEMNGVTWYAAQIVMHDDRGVPVMDYGAGQRVQAYFDSKGPTIVWANPYAVECEVYHWLHWALHRDAQRPAGANGEPERRYEWEIIGHAIDGDPLGFACNLAAVERFKVAAGEKRDQIRP